MILLYGTRYLFHTHNVEADAFMCPQLGSVIFQLDFIGHQTHLKCQATE